MKKYTQPTHRSNWLTRLLSLLLLCLAMNTTATNLITEDYQLSDKEVRVGEAYYRADMKWMVYQAEVSERNPFYQIYLKDLVSGKVQQVSPGDGKTTCAWVHPSQEKVLFYQHFFSLDLSAPNHPHEKQTDQHQLQDEYLC